MATFQIVNQVFERNPHATKTRRPIHYFGIDHDYAFLQHWFHFIVRSGFRSCHIPVEAPFVCERMTRQRNFPSFPRSGHSRIRRLHSCQEERRYLSWEP